MGEERGDMDKSVTIFRKFIGVRPWKRHSTILVVAGALYFLIGVYYIVGAPNKLRDDSLVVLIQMLPLPVWGGVFMLIGVIACVSSVWPPFHETWGYAVLTGLSSMWMAAYFLGFLLHRSQSLSGAILWGLVAFMWWAISGLLNPDKTGVVSRGPD